MKLKELLAKMEDNLKKYSVVTDNTFQQHLPFLLIPVHKIQFAHT